MNVFVFSEAAWDDKNSFGNTVSNFLCGDVWKNDHFCNFYARKQLPDNRANAVYYNLSAVDIVKGILKLHIEGRVFSEKDIPEKKKNMDAAHIKEQKSIDKLHNNHSEFIYYGHEQIWRSRLWRNRSFQRFVAENNPDILFAFATSPYILWPLIQYLKKHTACKVVLLVADDVYGSFDHCAFYRRGYLRRELENCILAADKLYGISDEMSELYSKRFGKPVTTLYKGCDLSMEPKQHLNQPLRFVYAGNLLWGREDTLAQVAEVLEKLNRDGQRAVLEIYTGTTITEQLRQKLERGSSSRIMGSRPYEEIKRIMHEADVVLHVESFEKKQQDTVRYSFSTKIIDCLQSGNQILGIGPEKIASIAYLRKIPGVTVVDHPGKMEASITSLVEHPQDIQKNVEANRRFARQNHDLGTVQHTLRKSLADLLASR